MRRKPTVLIVDDDDDARELYAWCMRAAGWFVEGVPTGEEALFVAAALAPDVIVMDLWLLVIDGLEATRRLKADPGTRHIPVIALSSIERAQGEALATEAGCALFLSKPCSPETLRALLESVVAGRDGSST
jgi:two-component system, cell cycle response regulator DivK